MYMKKWCAEAQAHCKIEEKKRAVENSVKPFRASVQAQRGNLAGTVGTTNFATKISTTL
jgi:hypothetical protein